MTALHIALLIKLKIERGKICMHHASAYLTPLVRTVCDALSPASALVYGLRCLGLSLCRKLSVQLPCRDEVCLCATRILLQAYVGARTHACKHNARETVRYCEPFVSVQKPIARNR
eukprot:SAG11_NODE_14321_length_617_cov_0.434363_1_plen_115_part_10